MQALLRAAGMLALCVLTPAVFALNESTDRFPLRGQYDVKVIETPELKQRFEQVVVVDVRTRYEYETLHIRGARHLPLFERDFIGSVRALSAANPSRTMVFYCTGPTCREAYDAAARAETAGVRHARVYDGGVLAWVAAHPELTLHRGRTPRPQELIAEEEFERHLVSSEEFERLVQRNDGAAIVLDIRDRVQRDVLLWPLRGQKRVPLDQRTDIQRVVDQAKREGKRLLVYDAAGDRIRWFQYYLKEKGLTDYRLMRGGVQAYFDSRYALGRATKVAAAEDKTVPARGAADLVRVKGRPARALP